MSKFSNGSKKKANNRLTDLQILGQIDSSEDPEGQFAMTKIDFRSGGISVGHKEFGSKNDALKALEQSKTRVSEIMQQARSMHLNSFKKSFGKIIKEDTIVAAMPRIRISAAKSHQRNNSIVGMSSNNLTPINKGGIRPHIGGLTPGNL